MASTVPKDAPSLPANANKVAMEPPVEAEIIAVIPPPADPKRSLPPPPKPQPEPKLSPTLSPLVRKLETVALIQRYNTSIHEFCVELPDTSIPRPVERKPSPLPMKKPVEDVTALVAGDVGLSARGEYKQFEEELELGLGAILKKVGEGAGG